MRHRYNEVGSQKTIVGWVLVSPAGTQLCDCLHTNVQGLVLIPDNALRHSTAQIFHQEPRTAFFRDREGVETHAPSIEGVQRADRGCMDVGG